MPNQKPLVTAAVFCDDVIIGADGSPTIVRIVDRGTVEVPPLPPGTQPSFRIHAFFSVKAGDLRGDYEFTITVRRPDGKSSTIPDKWGVHFDGEETGGNLKLQIGLPAVYGLYWLDLTWKGEVLSSTPFKLSEAARATPSIGQPT